MATIAARLAAHPPFDLLASDVLMTLANLIEIRYAEAQEVLFHQGDAAHTWVYVVHKGSVTLTRWRDNVSTLVELCDEGDIFGVRAHLTHAPYAATATAREESLLYALPFDNLAAIMTEVPALALHFAAGFAAELPARRAEVMHRVDRARRRLPSDDSGASVGSVAVSRELVMCGLEATVQHAAQKMTAQNVGSILIIDAARRPLGILTDSDLRNKVVCRALDVTTIPVAQVMSSPVLTVRETVTVFELISLMMQHRLHHVCVTEDGTAASPVVGGDFAARCIACAGAASNHAVECADASPHRRAAQAVA